MRLLSSTITRPADTTAYAAGDLVANSTTAGSVTPFIFDLSLGRGLAISSIQRVRLFKSAASATLAQFILHLFAGAADAATAGVPPRIMGFGPVPATQKLMERRGYKIRDFDIIELNEAFACQALACMRGLGLPDDAEHVNPNGGAIAIGHPLGMSGARLALTAALEMNDRKAKRALATMCIGVGQGIALALESVD
jgi:acetyl-CoA acetyltransferase